MILCPPPPRPISERAEADHRRSPSPSETTIWASRRGRMYRFRTRPVAVTLQFGRMGRLRQDRGLCPFACST